MAQSVGLERRCSFSCAHRYWNPHRNAAWNAADFGPLAEVHGHNLAVAAVFRRPVDPVTGVLVNLTDVKDWLRHAVQPLENRLVEATSPVMGGRLPSAEYDGT